MPWNRVNVDEQRMRFVNGICGLSYHRRMGEGSPIDGISGT
jgi:hypothetical protein